MPGVLSAAPFPPLNARRLRLSFQCTWTFFDFLFGQFSHVVIVFLLGFLARGLHSRCEKFFSVTGVTGTEAEIRGHFINGEEPQYGSD